MENLSMKRDGNKLTIEIDLGKDAGPSASGKTTIIASTRGNAPVPGADDTFVGLNCFKYANGKKKKG